MENISGAQLKCIKTMVSKLNVQDEDAMVLGFSSARTAHVSELSVTEAAAMIKHLKGLDPDEASAEKMRRKLIAMAYKYYGITGNATKEQKKEVMNRLNGWCQQYGKGGKRLDGYTVKELPVVVSQFERVLKQHLNKI